jgi:hypothetical protein
MKKKEQKKLPGIEDPGTPLGQEIESLVKLHEYHEDLSAKMGAQKKAVIAEMRKAHKKNVRCQGLIITVEDKTSLNIRHYKG